MSSFFSYAFVRRVSVALDESISVSVSIAFDLKNSCEWLFHFVCLYFDFAIMVVVSFQVPIHRS